LDEIITEIDEATSDMNHEGRKI